MAEDIEQVIETIEVDEPPSICFQAIRNLRSTDKNRTLESYNAPEAIIRERFGCLPVVGETICTYKEIEKPPNRIEYLMISSNRFKMFEGSWVLTAESSGGTKVTLTGSVDPGMRVPLWRQISKAATSSRLRKRLHDLQDQARKLAKEDVHNP